MKVQCFIRLATNLGLKVSTVFTLLAVLPPTCICAAGRVVTYPAPPGEQLSADYVLEVDGRPLDVYLARFNEPPREQDFAVKGPGPSPVGQWPEWPRSSPTSSYSFVQFDFSGTVNVKVHAPNRVLKRTIILPLSKRVKFSAVDANTITITLNKPCQLSVEPEGKRQPLLIFANPLEENVPKQGDPNILYFGPGIHRPEGGIIKLTSNQTLYVAGGAIIEGAIVADAAENVVIRGRGIISGNPWMWSKGPQDGMLALRRCRNVTVEGLVLRGSWGWTLVPSACENVRITNLKICNARVTNDDGIDLVNSRHVVIRECFVRTDDDCIALKGLDREWGNVDDIQIEDCVLWCDRARVTLLGHESRAEKMQNIVYRNLDVIHFGEWPVFLLEPGENMQLQNVSFENIRINGEGQDKIAIIRPIINQFMTDKTFGHIRDIMFKDVDVQGQPGKYHIIIEGGSIECRTAGISFDNVRIRGEVLTRDSLRVVFGHSGSNYVENGTVKFAK